MIGAVKWGHPLKGGSREKTPLPTKKIHLFSLVLLLSRQHSLALLSPFFAPVISFSSVSSQPKLIRTSLSRRS
jgi:hypothetical protein